MEKEHPKESKPSDDGRKEEQKQSKLGGFRRLMNSPWFLSILMFIGVFSLYHLNGKALPGGDGVPHRYLPLSILCEGNTTFNEFPFGRKLRSPKEKGLWIRLPYFLTADGGKKLWSPQRKMDTHSAFGFLPGVMATPVFAVAFIFNKRFDFKRILELSKTSAALMIALSLLLLFWAFSPLIGRNGAVVLALSWALGTSAWCLMSQMLWQHSAAAPWLAGALLCLVLGREKPRLMAFSAFLFALATIARPANAVIAVSFTGYVFFHHRTVFKRFVLWALGPALFLLLYNYIVFGSPFMFGQLAAIAQNPHWQKVAAVPGWQRAFTGWAGTLFSPSRGLFVYSPFLLFGLVGLFLSFRKGGDALYRWSFAAVLGVVLLQGAWYDWWGGWTFGYRRSFDIVFLLVLGICPLWSFLTRKRWLTSLFVLALAFSFWVQILGAFSYNIVGWNGRPDVNHYPERLWSVSDSQLAHYLRSPSWEKPLYGSDCVSGNCHLWVIDNCRLQKKKR